MRTRKSNRTKRFSYTATYGIESDEDTQEPLEHQDANEDVDFDAKNAEDQSESDDEDGDEDAVNEDAVEDGGLSGGERQGNELDGDDEIIPVESDDDDGDGVANKLKRAPRLRGRWKKRLVKRSTVHGVPPYPTDLRLTRVYEGPLKRWTRSTQLLNILYGPDDGHVMVVRAMLRKWFGNHILPNRSSTGKGGVMQSPWLAEDYEMKQKQWSKTWYERYRAAQSDLQRSQKIRPDHVKMFRPPLQDMICFLGPLNNQKQVRTSYAFGQSVSETGQPLEAVDTSLQKSTSPGGWLLDTGGLPLGVGWAPLIGHREQFLAVCTIPYSDQEPKYADAPADDPEEKKRGSVQIWSIPCHEEDGSASRLVHSLWFDWGRPKRIQWCPVPLPDDSKIGMLAVLCSDGQVRVIEVPKPIAGQTNYEWITSPVATLGFTDEYAVFGTSLTWVNTNRICLGHTDGSISLWSVYPRLMLMRRSVHISYILDISSGFPSHPYHIATTPVGGCPTVTDLNLPSAETTYIPMLGAINFQPNLMDWNDHLQGWFGIHPSPTPHNTILGWAHIRFFVQSRTLMTTPSPPMCLSTGKTHPFTLVGCADGSLWALNPLRTLLKERGDSIHKIRVFLHEFRPAAKIAAAVQPGEDVRGAARVLQGFLPEMNSNPRAEYVRDMNKKRADMRNKKSKSKKRKFSGPPKDGDMDMDESDQGMTKSQGEALSKLLDKTRAVVHEARTRVTTVAWNPNVEYGWWAAAAMGSGLVKVMDLGVGG